MTYGYQGKQYIQYEDKFFLRPIHATVTQNELAHSPRFDLLYCASYSSFWVRAHSFSIIPEKLCRPDSGFYNYDLKLVHRNQMRMFWSNFVLIVRLNSTTFNIYSAVSAIISRPLLLHAWRNFAVSQYQTLHTRLQTAQHHSMIPFNPNWRATDSNNAARTHHHHAK